MPIAPFWSSVAPPVDAEQPNVAPGGSRGLTTDEAVARGRQFGPNAIPEHRRHPLTTLLRKLSGPVPWMLEAALLLEVVLGKHVEAAILVGLLLLNAGVSFSHERRAQGALELLRTKLRVLARVRRDGSWTQIPTDALVPGDVVHVRMGDFVPADLRLEEGDVLLDRSTLTGESAPVEARGGEVAAAGSVVRRGEATGEVVATGVRTVFGRTVSLIQEAQGKSHLEALVLTMVTSFVALDGVLAALVFSVALSKGERLVEIAPFVLMLLIASVPVALPAMFTLATAVGSAELARRNVLVTRLAALEEVAALDVLCSDKTGTLTQNKLALAVVTAVGTHSQREVVQFAALASDPATQDPIDLAILEAAKDDAIPSIERIELVPFDPATKSAEALVRRDGTEWRVIKGAPAAVAAFVSPDRGFALEVTKIAERGCRVLAVAAGPPDDLRMLGFIGLLDPPRADSRAVVARLKDLGLRVVMVTGDSSGTAAAMAKEMGIGSRVATKPDAEPSSFDALAGILPEDKFRLVRSLQSVGHVVAMTGDGVNDAPALKQADVGIAVASAVDVAKSAASVVLTEPGLGGVLAAIEVGRRIYQRMLTYTLNMSVKKLEIPVFLAIGFLAFKTYVVTPRLLLFLMVTNDLSTMTLASDHVRPSPRPERWNGRALVLGAFGLSVPWLAFLITAFELAPRLGSLSPGARQTFAFLSLVFIGQANVYVAREPHYLWRSMPGTWTLVASVVTMAVVSTFATTGVLMERLPMRVVLVLFASVVVFTIVLDVVKVQVFARLRLRG
ncbi:MAG TPA: plasma-membrane proton-efflux P-type ATPase [Polyangiaceae bacterium]|nr:plasma-membrane proton-efflux P-type ATPase [Polyangiaceae bacterium]